MLLPLLFTIKKLLTNWLKRSVYSNIIPAQRSVIISGTTSTTSSTTRYDKLLQGAATVPQVLRGATSGNRRYYEILRLVLRVTMWY